jgi:hypothetical protein
MMAECFKLLLKPSAEYANSLYDAWDNDNNPANWTKYFWSKAFWEQSHKK